MPTNDGPPIDEPRLNVTLDGEEQGLVLRSIRYSPAASITNRIRLAIPTTPHCTARPSRPLAEHAVASSRRRLAGAAVSDAASAAVEVLCFGRPRRRPRPRPRPRPPPGRGTHGRMLANPHRCGYSGVSMLTRLPFLTGVLLRRFWCRSRLGRPLLRVPAWRRRPAVLINPGHRAILRLP